MMTHVIPTSRAVVAQSRLQDRSVLLSGTLWPTVNVPLASPILMMSVQDIAVGNEWQPGRQWFLLDYSSVSTRLGQVARIAQLPRRSSGRVAFLLLPVPRSTRVLHLRCSGCSSSVALGSSHQAHLPVWPSSRLFWPPLRKVRQRGSVAACVCRSHARSWSSTLRWFPLSVAQGCLMRGVLISMGQRPWQHEGGNSDATLGWRVRMDVRGWWSLRVRLEGDSPRNVATSSASCPS